jgi:predicted RNA binding protein YcfA (HicA-like mRNA interferase family)
MKVGEAIKLLKDNGFEEVNQKGSHKKFRHPDGRVKTIVYHSKDSEELCRKSIKELKNIIK